MDTPSTPGPLFVSDEEAQNWALDLAGNVKEMRVRLDLERDAAKQRKLYATLVVRYGAAKGALDALFRCGRVSATFHETVAQAILLALAVKTTDFQKPEGL